MKNFLLLAFLGFHLYLSAQDGTPIFSNLGKNSLSGNLAVGASGQGVYLSGFGILGARFEKIYMKHFGISTGLNLMANGYEGSIGVPVYFQLKALSEKGRGFIANLGGIAQYGWKPFLLPSCELRGRFGFGEHRFFFDLYVVSYWAYRYTCSNGTYTCPDGPFTKDGWTANPGLGLAMGAYLK